MRAAESKYEAQFASLRTKQSPGGNSSFSFGWGQEVRPVIVDKEIHEEIPRVLEILPAKVKTAEVNQDVISSSQVLAPQKPDETSKRKKAEEEILKRLRLQEEKKENQRKLTTKTSVKVGAPPGGRSRMPLG